MNIEETTELSGFAALGITGALLKATANVGFDQPKPIQSKAIPPHLAGRDVLGVAQTGSGKTAAFSLPILMKVIGLGTRRLPKTARALILAPTRELAVQIEETIRDLAKGLHVSTALVLGGVSRGSQVRKVAPGVDFLIATPGRLTDLVREGDVKLCETRWLVLDEADRMLDMGFIHDVKRLAKATHPERQTALFSATMPDEIAVLAQTLLKNPVRVDVAPQGTTAPEIAQSVMIVPAKGKRQVLSNMLADDAMKSVLVFARTKHGADKVLRNLQQDGFDAAVIHGNKSQNARQTALNGFRDGKTRILVATDIAARGIDVVGISHVVNYELPDEPESYVHRIGRTGRNGMSGIAVTLCDPSENSKLRSVERVIRMKLPVSADHTGMAITQSDAKPDRPFVDSRAPRRDGRPQGQPHRQNRNPLAKAQHSAPRPEVTEAGGFNGLPGSRGAGNAPGGAKPAGDRPFRGKPRRGGFGRKPASRAA